MKYNINILKELGKPTVKTVILNFFGHILKL